MIKKVIIIIFILILISSTVSAQTMVGKYLKIEWDSDPEIQEKRLLENEGVCFNEFVLQNEINWWNNNDFYIQVLEMYDDGYYVLKLNGEKYLDSEYFTMFKNEKGIKWIKKGFCVNNKDYTLFSTSLDINQTEQEFYSKYKNKNLDIITEGYKVLKQIDGIEIYDKVKIVSLASSYIATHPIYKEDVNNE